MRVWGVRFGVRRVNSAESPNRDLGLRVEKLGPKVYNTSLGEALPKNKPPKALICYKRTI